MSRKPIFAYIENQAKVFEYIKQTRVEDGCWAVFGKSSATYYRYKAKDKEFREKVNTLLDQVRQVPINEDPELIKEGKQLFKNWFLGGCKTTRRRIKYTSVPCYNPDGSVMRNKKGEAIVDWVPSELTVDVYDNGVNLKAMELIFPPKNFAENALTLVLCSQYELLQERKQSLDPALYSELVEFLNTFRVEAVRELRAMGKPTPLNDKGGG